MKKNLIVVLIFTFIMNILNNLGHPVTPSFVGSLNIPDYMFGVFFATMSLGMMLSAPLWGALSDNGSTKKYIIIGVLIYAVAQLGFGLVHNKYLMVGFRFLGGVGVGAPMTLLISLVVGHSDKNRVTSLSIMAALSTLGASVGYKLGGSLGDSEFYKQLINTPSYENVFIFQFVGLVIFSLLVFIFIKDYKKENRVQRSKNPFSALAKIKTLDVRLIIFLISLSMITIGSTNLSKYIDVYFRDLNLSTTSLGDFVFVTGLVSVVTSIFIAPLVAKIKKQLTVIIIIQVLSALIVFYVFRVDKNSFLFTIYTVYNIYVMLKAIYLPLEQNLISSQADEESIGTVIGIRQSFISIGNVIGPLFGGVLYSIRPLLLFDVSGVFFLIGGLLLILILNINKKRDPEISDAN